MARGNTRASSESVIRALGGGNDEIAQYRSSQRASEAYRKVGNALDRLTKQVDPETAKEIKAFQAGNAARLKAAVDNNNFLPEVSKMIAESDQKLAEVRAKTGVLGELPVRTLRPDIETLVGRFGEDKAWVLTGKDGKEVIVVSDQLKTGDKFTFTDDDDKKITIDNSAVNYRLKDLPGLEERVAAGEKIYEIEERYWKRGEPNIND